jgi:N-acetylmuramoyl-L-alanine amidase
MGEKPGGPVRVVIDPGHGGKDPGTEAAEAAPEKLIALQIAERLAATLSRNGIQTALTRDDDYFLSLAQRTQFANREGADLFVSIHLNSSPNPETNGLEVYYLNNTTDRATIRLARMENALAAEDGAEPEPNLNYILSDLRQQYKATESAMLAQMIEEQTVSELQSSFGSEIRGLGAKKGPFYVLVGAHMPAVLVECGFLSNEEEARRLTSERYQDGLADGIATALLRYLNADVAAGTL